MTDEYWAERAACRNSVLEPDAWWGTDMALPRTREAIRICKFDCPVRDDCLTHAISIGEQEGIWGGMTPSQRKAAARARRMNAPAW